MGFSFRVGSVVTSMPDNMQLREILKDGEVFLIVLEPINYPDKVKYILDKLNGRY